MLTNNWKNLVRAHLCFISDDVTELTFTSCNGNVLSSKLGNVSTDYMYSMLLFSMGSVANNYSGKPSVPWGTGVIFGDGTTPPTVDDFHLSGANIIPGSAYTMTTVRSATINDDGSITRTALYTITNGSADDFTISEIGVYQSVPCTGANGHEENYVLMDRTLLDEPVTIPAGGVGQVTYNVTFDVGIYEA